MPERNCASKTVMIAAGGTGGHVFPALAVAEKLRNLDVDIVWVGTQRGIESRVVSANGFPIFYINVVGLRGKRVVQRLIAPVLLIKAIVQLLILSVRKDVAVVLGMGGFVSAAAGVAAILLRRPLILQEQNAVPGSTNRLLAPFARRIFTGFQVAFAKRNNASYTGNPLRESVAELAGSQRDCISLNMEKTGSVRLLVIGGSLGARVLNQKIPQALASLSSKGIGDFSLSVTHQCGAVDVDDVRMRYATTEVDAVVESFIDDVASAYLNADLVIARAGALTVAEIAAAGVASILVPYPYAIDDHQMANAGWLAENDAAVMIAESEFEVDRIVVLLEKLLREPTRLDILAANAKKMAKYDAAEVIASGCQEICHGV